MTVGATYLQLRNFILIPLSEDYEAFQVLCKNTLDHIALSGVAVPPAMVERLMVSVRKHPYGPDVLLAAMKDQKGGSTGGILLNDASFEQGRYLLIFAASFNLLCDSGIPSPWTP